VKSTDRAHGSNVETSRKYQLLGIEYNTHIHPERGPGSSIGIATGYGLDGPRIEKKNPGGGEIFRTRPDRHWGPPGLLYNGYWVFPGGKTAGAWC
jgi:hypothetical protein